MRTYTHLKLNSLVLSLMLTLMCTLVLQAQKPGTDYVVRLRGDTLQETNIVMKSPYPQKNALVIQLRKRKTRTYRPRSIAAYFYDNKYYESLELKGGKRPKRIFARKLVGGDISLYITMDDRVKELYVQKFEELPRLLSWTDYEKTLDKYMEDPRSFKEYMKSLKKDKVFYDEYSMVEYLSHYNAYLEPEKYRPIELPFFERMHFSIYASAGLTSFKKIKADVEINNPRTTNFSNYALGVNLQQEVFPFASMNIGLTLNFTNLKLETANGALYDISYRSIQNPAYVSIEGYIRNTVKYYFEVGTIIRAPTRARGVDERGVTYLLGTDIRIAPMLGAGVGYRLRDGRQVRVFLRGDTYKQKFLDSNPLPGNFIPTDFYRFVDLGLYASWEF